MAQVIDLVRRVRGFQEPNGSFCTEGSIGSFWDIPAVEDTFKLTLDRPQETPGILQQHLDGMPTKVFMPKSAKLDFSLNLQTFATRATNGVTVTPNALGNLLEIMMGGEFLGTGTTVNDASATTTSCVLTSAAGFREGGAIAFATGTGGALEMREIKTISSNTVTWKLALAAAPSNGSTAYGCSTYYLDNTDGSTVLALQAAVEGLDDNDRFLLLGGQIASPPTLELQPGGIPRIATSWLFANWLYANGSNTTMNLTSAAIADQALSSAGIHAAFDSWFRIQTHATTTLSAALVDAPQINIAPQFAYTPHKTPAGTNTIKQWVRNRVAPACIGDFAVPRDAVTWFDFRDNQTARALTYQIGTSATTGGSMISVPHILIDNAQREGVDGIASERLNWYAKLDNQTTANSTNIQKSAFRIHFA